MFRFRTGRREHIHRYKSVPYSCELDFNCTLNQKIHLSNWSFVIKGINLFITLAQSCCNETDHPQSKNHCGLNIFVGNITHNFKVKSPLKHKTWTVQRNDCVNMWKEFSVLISLYAIAKKWSRFWESADINCVWCSPYGIHWPGLSNTRTLLGFSWLLHKPNKFSSQKARTVYVTIVHLISNRTRDQLGDL